MVQTASTNVQTASTNALTAACNKERHDREYIYVSRHLKRQTGLLGSSKGQTPPYTYIPGRIYIGKWLAEDTESYYGSPPNSSLTKSPVIKPLPPGRISWHTVPVATPATSFDSPLQTRKYAKVLFFIASFLVSSSQETFVKEYRCFWRGLS